MKLRTVSYKDGRCEIVQVLDDSHLKDWSSSDPLGFEASIMWLYPPEKIPFVRVMTVRNCRSRRGRLTTGGTGRVIGYSRLTSDAPYAAATGGFIRRVFYVLDEDIQNNRIVSDRVPSASIDPTSIAPGKKGEPAKRKQEAVNTAHQRDQAVPHDDDDEISKWIDEEMLEDSADANALDAFSSETDTALPDCSDATELEDESLGTPPSVLGRLVRLDGEGSEALTKAEIYIGRSNDCDIVLNYPNVSGLHCEMMLESDAWFVRDIGSSNGTRIDGQVLEIGERYEVAPGSTLTIATVDLRLEV